MPVFRAANLSWVRATLALGIVHDPTAQIEGIMVARFQINGFACDWPGCTAYVMHTANDHTPEVIRQYVAESVGWYERNRKHYCPQHAEGARPVET